MEEASVLAFLFGRQASIDDDVLGGITLIQQDLLGIVGWLELLHWRLADRHILLG
jgi:hypothetical protein